MKKPDKKRRILDAAMELFARKGYEKTTISDIASRAHVGKGTIYVYFDSKSDILREILAELAKGLAKDIEESSKSGNMRAFIEELSVRLGKKLEIKSRLMHTLQREGLHPRRNIEIFREIYDGAMKTAYDNLRVDMDFDEFYFNTTTFLISSFAAVQKYGKEKTIALVKKALEKLLL